MDPQIIEFITKEVYSQIIYIIGWTIGIVTPVITGLIIALKILWNYKKDYAKKLEESSKAHTLKQEEIIINYYEVTKSLITFLQKSTDVESRTMEVCEKLLRAVEALETKEEITNKYVLDIYNDLKDITLNIESKLNKNHEDVIVIKTNLENFIKNAESILKDVKDKDC